MKRFFVFYRTGIAMGALIATLFTWAVSSTLWALSLKPQTVIIGLTPDGARIITGKEDKTSDLDTQNFIRRFVALAFNYTNTTYVENVTLATDLMSEALFESQRSEFQRVSEALKLRELDQSATISSIKRLEPGRFEVMIKTNQMLDRRNDSFDTRVRIKIEPTERTTRNPWGMEISEYSYDRP